VNRLGDLLGQDVEVGLPHVTAEVADRLAILVAEDPEEAAQAVLSPIEGDVKQALRAGIDLVNDGPIAVAALPLDLIDADGLDPAQFAVFQAPRHGVLDRAVDGLPGGVECRGDLLPRQPLGPTGQEPAIGDGQWTRAITPGDFLDRDAAEWAVGAPRCVDEGHGDLPERNELVTARREASAGP